MPKSDKRKKNLPLEKETLNPLIGLELTFSNSSTKSDFGEKGLKNHESTKKYHDFLENLKKSFDSIKFDLEEDFPALEISQEILDSNKDLGDSSYGVQDLKINFLDKEGSVKFWINITRDPQVIEIQTMPVPVSEFKKDNSLPSKVLDCLFSKVFGNDGCMKYGGDKLFPSKEGGGHINVDAKSSGLDNKEAVFELMQKWDKVDSSKTEGLVIEESQTAARLKDTRYDRKFSTFKMDNYSSELLNLIEKALDTKSTDNSAVLKSLSEAYWTYPQVKLFPRLIPDGSTKKSDEELRICIHNQAINIEHLFEEDVKSRRVEFREFEAQKSRDDVLGCWGIIEELLLKIKTINNKFSKLEDVKSDDLSDREERDVEKPSNVFNPKKEAVSFRGVGNQKYEGGLG